MWMRESLSSQCWTVCSVVFYISWITLFINDCDNHHKSLHACGDVYHFNCIVIRHSYMLARYYLCTMLLHKVYIIYMRGVDVVN
jgi:hypothetical protein